MFGGGGGGYSDFDAQKGGDEVKPQPCFAISNSAVSALYQKD